MIQNVAIGLVGKDTPFRVFDEEETGKYLAVIEGEERRGTSSSAPADEPGPAAPPSGEDAPRDPEVATAMDTE